MGYAIVSDKNIENLEIGDKVLLFGKIGTVAVVSGAYGIYFKDGVPWELINSKIPEIVKDEKIRKERTPNFCYCDRFVSFFELIWNFNCIIQDVCDVVEKLPIGTCHICGSPLFY